MDRTETDLYRSMILSHISEINEKREPTERDKVLRELTAAVLAASIDGDRVTRQQLHNDLLYVCKLAMQDVDRKIDEMLVKYGGSS